uniref:Uncharacterized protein n=1 Tax=Oryza nivara TaxID=4536 RepID=A0A0E0J1A6_ORYNI
MEVVAPRRAEAGAPLVLALGLGVTVVPAAACRFCASGMDAGSPRRPATVPSDTSQVSCLIPWYQGLIPRYHPVP